MQGKLIVIEAGDGSGKATQARELCRRLEAEGYPVRLVEFPDYTSPSSALIKMYLNGEFGEDPTTVSPYVASIFYTVDRFASFASKWGDFYRQGGIVIADRYSTSNMVHQAAKLDGERAREEFLAWLWELEFNKFRLPVPDLVIFLDVPPALSRELLRGRQVKSGDVVADIHECNSTYLDASYRNAVRLAAKYNWHRLSCVQDGTMRKVADIHAEIYDIVRTKVLALPSEVKPSEGE